MPKFIQNKDELVQNLTEVKLQNGNAYIKTLPFTMFSDFTDILSGKLEGSEQVKLYARIIQSVLVDEDGNHFEDVTEASVTELESMFSIQDFGVILNAISVQVEETKNLPGN